MKSPRAEGGGIARPRRRRRREERAQPHGSSAAQRPRPRPSGRARPSRPSSWRLSRVRTTRRPSPRATCASSSRPRPAWTCAWCRSAPRAPAPAASLPAPRAPRAPRPLTRCPSPGLVPEPPSQGEETEEGRGPAALGSVFPQHEARPRGLQVRQGQRPGGGAGQRRRGLLRRYAQARGAPPASSGSGRKERGAGWSQGAWKSEFPSQVACLALLKKNPFVDPGSPPPSPVSWPLRTTALPLLGDRSPVAWPGQGASPGGRAGSQPREGPNPLSGSWPLS